MSAQRAFETHLRTVYLGGWYRDVRLGEEQFAALEELAELCRQRGIDLQVFISPVHAAQWEAALNSGLLPTLEAWKRRLVRITPVWDFSGYNDITGEPLAADMRHYLESSHYRPHVGEMVIRRIYEEPQLQLSGNFGHRTTVENIEAQLERFRHEREQWARARPQEARLYERWAGAH
jgi:hypothetical protein